MHPNSTGYSLLSIYYTLLRFSVLMTTYESHKLGVLFATQRKTYSTRRFTIVRAREMHLGNGEYKKYHDFHIPNSTPLHEDISSRVCTTQRVVLCTGRR